MKSRLVGLSALILLFVGCDSQPPAQHNLAVRVQYGASLSAPRSVRARQNAQAHRPLAARVQAAERRYPARVVAPAARRQAMQPKAEPAESPAEAAGRLEPGDSMAYQISARHLPVPIKVSQQVVSRTGERLIVDQTIDDGFVEPLELRLRIDESTTGPSRIVSVARLERGVQLPYGSAAYQQLLTMMGPMIEGEAQPAEAPPTNVELGSAVLECERSGYLVQVDGELAAMTVMDSPEFAWGHVGTKVYDVAGHVLYEAKVVELGGEHFGSAAMMVAQNEGSDGDYEAWEAEGAEELVAAPVMVAELDGSEADYEAWDGEAEQELSEPVGPIMLAALVSPDADYEAWEAEGDALDAVDEAELAGAIGRAPAAIATRDDSADYVVDDDFEL